MRAATTAQNTALTAEYYTPGLRVLIADGDNNLRDWSNQAGVNWIDSVEIDLDIDQPVSAATVQLRRDAGPTKSLAPFRSDSTLNVYSGGYAPAIAPGRLLIIQAASVAAGTTPITADFVEVFRGYVDRVTWSASSIVVTVRDIASANQDRFIKTETVYGSTGGVPMETVMQTILNAWGDSSTLFVPVSPSFLITTYKQQPQSVMDALLALAQTAGWTVGVLWDSGTSAYRLTLYNPNRTKSVADQSISASRYLSVSDLFIDRLKIRNNIQVNYFDTSLGAMTSIIRMDATSQAQYGDRWFGITEASTSQINTATQATAMCQAVLADLKDPKAEHEIEMHFDWRIELCDLLKFLANGVHYNSDQSEAVVTITHKLTNTSHRTTVRTRGEPAGQYFGWLARGVGVQPTQGPSLSVVATPGSTSYSIAWSGDFVQVSINGAVFATPSASPIVVARSAAGGADKVYTFSGFRDGVATTLAVVIPAQSGSTAPSGTLTPTLTNNQVDDTTLTVTCVANASNLPAAYTWKIIRGFSAGQETGSSLYSGSNSSNPLGGGGFSFSVTPNLKNSFWYLLVVTTALGDYTAEMQVQGRWSFIDPSTGNASSGATTSTGAAVNRSYAKPLSSDPDNADSIANGLTFGGARLAYLDSGRPNALYRSTGAASVDADTLAGGLGLQPANKLANGNAESGALGGSLNWTYDQGNALQSYSATKYSGTRSWLIDNSGGANNSASHQDVKIEAGKVYLLTAWMLCTGLTSSAGGYGAVLNAQNIAPGNPALNVTVLEKVGDDPNSSVPDVGIHATGGSGGLDDGGWHRVYSVFRCNVTTVLRLLLQLGYNGNITGQVFFDDVALQEVPPQAAQGGVRGYSALDSNARLASQRNLKMLASAGPFGTVLQFVHGTSTPIAPVSSSGTSVSVAAHDAKIGSGAVVAYSSGSLGTWPAGSPVYVYCFDDTFAGGTGSSGWQATNSVYDILSSDSIYYAGQVTPASSGGGGGATCPDPDEPILLADGREIRAGDLSIGDLVRTAHEETGEWGVHQVSHVQRVERTGRTRLVLTDGREIVASPSHPVYVESPDNASDVVKMCVLNLRPGMRLAGTVPGVVSHVEDAGIGPVMVIEVEGAHTYVLRGILSHNKVPQ